MKYIVTGKQMQAADKHTIEQMGVPSMVLMERAALGVVDVIENKNLDLSNTLVVCGPGNNGGDGYAIARLLHLKGHKVTLWFVGEEAKRSTENLAQKKIAESYKVPEDYDQKTKEYTLVIDAVFGTGLKRNVEGAYKKVIDKINQMTGYKVSVDLPSGLNDETGDAMGCAVNADLTIALGYAKLGHVLISGNPYVGKLKVVDIGICDSSLVEEKDLVYTYDFEDFLTRYPKRISNSHKGTYGKVLLIVGSKGMAGAAQLCARAAYMVGAGLVRIYTHEENREILQKTLPEAMVSTYTKYDEEELNELVNWASVIGIGCGLGMSDVARNITKQVLKKANVPCVADADALNIVAGDLQILEELKTPFVFTPHMKEMARLLQCEIEELQINKIEKLKEFCNTYPITCVLKDARTLVGCKNQDYYLNLTGNSAMAKGGSGDVLTGIIVGILAQTGYGYESACLGVYLHGMSGDCAAKEKGDYSVLASDLVDYVGEVLKQI